MAHISPGALPSIKKNGGLFRELQVIERLTLSLPDNYEIFHSIPLHTVDSEVDRFSEIDILILAPAGQILLMEVKAGDVVLRDGGIFKLYSGKEHDVGLQCRIQYGAFRNRLQEANIETSVNTCLVIPDYILTNEHTIAMPQDRIIDASRYEQLGTYVKEFLSAGKTCSDISALRRFLRNEFQVNVDLTVMKDQLQTTVRQLSDGLATWVPRITSPSGMYQIQATAGSGKTQLALNLLTSAVSQKKSVAYVCYNRTLADHFRGIAPSRATISNFHELCVEHFRRHHAEPDFSQENIFELVTTTYLTDSQAFSPKFDLLIIDEGQDFAPEWLESLAAQLKENGQLYFLQDEDQRLYKRTMADIEEAVLIECQDNFRSPRLICDVINTFQLSRNTVQSKNPFKGNIPVFHEYINNHQLLEKTEFAVDNLLSQGFTLSDIVVLTACGRDRSVLLSQNSIGKYKTRQFTGNYTCQGEPIWTQGDLLVESVYRYKGQSSPAVILSEIHFAELTLQEKRKLFVGMTRAQMTVEIILSEQAARVMNGLIT